MQDQLPGASPPTIACPFCGLGCDDLSPRRGSDGDSVDSGGCALADYGFRTALNSSQSGPRIDGKPASLDDALARIVQRLKGARLPLFAGLSGDLVDMRGALRLAERTGGALDHRNGEALICNQSVLEETGWMVTSLGEVRNRTDLLVLVGQDLPERFPRLKERVVQPSQRLHTQNPVTLVEIGPEERNDASGAENIPLPMAQLRDFIGMLRARLAGRPVTTDRFPLANELAERLSAAKYPVIAFSAAALCAEPHADLAVRALSALVRDLNAKGRAALLPLGGGDGETSAQQVSAWHTGFGVRQTFHTGKPQYRPRTGDARRLLASGGADLLVWISTLNDDPPPATGVPTLVLGHPAMQCKQEPEVFVPLAVPGIHRAGAVHRGDGLAVLPLSAITDNSLPQSDQVFARLLGLLCEERTPC